MIITTNVHPVVEKYLSDECNLLAAIEVNKFTEESASEFRSSLDMCENMCAQTGQKRIPIMIDSYGGEVYSLLSMIDRIGSCRYPVDTIVLGKAFSCGAILFSCGDKRYAADSSTIMVHNVRGCAYGNVHAMQSDANHGAYLDAKAFSILDKNTGQVPGYWAHQLQVRSGNSELYLTPPEAVVHGLVTHIGLPELKVNVSVEVRVDGQ